MRLYYWELGIPFISGGGSYYYISLVELGDLGGTGHPLKEQRRYSPMRPRGDWGIPIKVRIACLIGHPLGVCHK